jgi:biopolymer transport protein ExbD
MKILLGFIILISICACGQTTSLQKGKFISVYIAGCDSIFCCEGQELNLETLRGGKKDDSIFINKKVAEFKKDNKEIYIKVFGGYCGGTAGTTEEFTHLFDRKNIKWRIVEPDSLEENHFNDVSLLKAVQQIKIELNEPKEEVNLPDSKPFFQFILKANGNIYYSYDSTDMNRNLIIINQPTKEKLIQALNNSESKHNIKLEDKRIIIRGDASARYPQFKLIKEALKAKNLFRFKFVTDSSTPPKKPEEEIPLVITAKALTLLISATDELYYYHGTDCSSMVKSSLGQIKSVLKNEKTNTPLKDIMIAIKQEEGGSFKAVINILDEINLSKIPARHFAEIEITESEINCIKNYKNK